MREPEIRRHYFLDRYVVLAPGRLQRPHQTAEPAHAASAKSCHFCPGHEDPEAAEITRIDDGKGGWLVRVIPNKYPAFTPENPRAFGYQEIVIGTPQHGKDVGDFSVPEIERLLGVYAERIEELSSRDHIRYVLVFKNEGGRAGASIEHAHSQIFAISLVPPEIRHEADLARSYSEEHQTSCAYCEILRLELSGPRLIWEDEHVAAIAPYAPIAPYEVMILPKAHHPSLPSLNQAERSSVAAALKQVLHRLEEEGIAYNYYIHNSLEEETHHVHFKILPRPNIWGGFELGSGIYINPVFPEDVPRFYAGTAPDAPRD